MVLLTHVICVDITFNINFILSTSNHKGQFVQLGFFKIKRIDAIVPVLLRYEKEVSGYHCKFHWVFDH